MKCILGTVSEMWVPTICQEIPYIDTTNCCIRHNGPSHNGWWTVASTVQMKASHTNSVIWSGLELLDFIDDKLEMICIRRWLNKKNWSGVSWNEEHHKRRGWMNKWGCERIYEVKQVKHLMTCSVLSWTIIFSLFKIQVIWPFLCCWKPTNPSAHAIHPEQCHFPEA